MANALQRGTKQFPNGTNVPKTGVRHNLGPQVQATNRRPTAQSTSNNVGSATYQPFPGAKSAGAAGKMSASSKAPDFGQLNTPIKKALGKRKMGSGY